MSVRAYRVEKIERCPQETFNLWHDAELVLFLEEHGSLTTLDDDLAGLVDVSVELLEQAIKGLTIADDVREALQQDIDKAKAKGEDYIQYYCL